MRVAIVSDIHGNLPALEAVVRDIGRRGVDTVVNLGDSLSGPLLPLQTAQFLMAPDWTHLGGNHERQVLDLDPLRADPNDAFTRSELGAGELAWLARLAPRLQYCPEMLLCHGTPDSDHRYLLETVTPTQLRRASQTELDARLGVVAAELVACGHSHVPRAMRASTGQLVVNPGSVGQQAFDDDLPYPHTVESGSPDARYAIVERQAGQWSTSLVAVPYAFQAMVALARSRGRHDWACLLGCGRWPAARG